MDWQTITTIFILTIAAAILLNRVWALLRSGKTGNCGSCGGCGGSSKSTELLQLVPLGTGPNPPKIAAGRHGSSDAGAEKTG
jgi:hypothetical protein